MNHGKEMQRRGKIFCNKYSNMKCDNNYKNEDGYNLLGGGTAKTVTGGAPCEEWGLCLSILYVKVGPDVCYE